MDNVIMFEKHKTPYKIYADVLDQGTIEQFNKVLEASFVTQAALMPDAHSGYTMPIGGVCSTNGVIVPVFVGFDIGCGVTAYRTDHSVETIRANAKAIYDKLNKEIPLGRDRHNDKQEYVYNGPASSLSKDLLDNIGLYQLGTLGGGNHFIEIGVGRDNYIWVIIHSGSRGFGAKIAEHYMGIAFAENNGLEDIDENVITEWENKHKDFKIHNRTSYDKALVAFKEKIRNRQKTPKEDGKIYGLMSDSTAGIDYINDHNFALDFAYHNRKKMIIDTVSCIDKVLGTKHVFNFDNDKTFINKSHNHVLFDRARGEWVHRKGATIATEGILGVIPGDMLNGSFIVRGKGSSESLDSASHGAGRVMSRRKAIDQIDLKDFETAMEGIAATVNEHTVDESPFAYKDIYEVMKQQSDLVEIVDHIKPIINIKHSSD